MIIKNIEIERFRAFEHVSFSLGKRITAISGRNATQKTTVLGMIGQPFTISSKDNPMYGCKTIDGYNFRSQFSEKFKISPIHDKIGEHKWKLQLHNGVYKQNYFTIESIARKQNGRPSTLRFWNSESRSQGAGYIQLPVYFLSLSRLFPIGETGKTHTIPSTLTPEELLYCIDNYVTILSIQNIEGTPSVGLEKGTASRTFSGISDNLHDIFTNSAGEGNITRIILAVLSFKRLQEQYGKDYKGGILLIDELDATLYGFSQVKLIEYLWKAAGDYKIQIVFTTHSPIILKTVNKLQRNERLKKGMNLPFYAYDTAIVYLKPQYNEEGKRTITPKNILTSRELNVVLKDMNLQPSLGEGKINIYCEDKLAISFLQFILESSLAVSLDQYMNFVDIDLSWTHYVKLAEKKVPEFLNNIVVLDGDVPSTPEYKKNARTISNFKNFLYLPLTIEKDLFILLKDHASFIRFQKSSARSSDLSYDVCFNHWPLKAERYNTIEFKHWYEQVVLAIGDQNVLFSFWCNEHRPKVDAFVENFINTFNLIAQHNDVDVLPMITR